MIDSLLNVGTVIFCAVVILYYLHEAEYAPEEIDTGDALMIIWALLNLLKVVFTC